MPHDLELVAIFRVLNIVYECSSDMYFHKGCLNYGNHHLMTPMLFGSSLSELIN
jgi:hypothetical protein